MTEEGFQNTLEQVQNGLLSFSSLIEFEKDHHLHCLKEKKKKKNYKTHTFLDLLEADRVNDINKKFQPTAVFHTCPNIPLKIKVSEKHLRQDQKQNRKFIHYFISFFIIQAFTK